MKVDEIRGLIDKALIGLLSIVFIVLKLTKVITWSWLWVLSPFWVPAALILVIGVILLPIKGRGDE
jgi:hypothetical protein